MAIKIIGTGHVLKKSVDEVREEILKGNYDIVCVELDKERFEILKSNDLKFEKFKFSFKFFLNPSDIMRYILWNIQKEIGKKLNVFPGSEMKEAISLAEERNLKIFLIDRDIRITMNHLMNIPLKEKIKMLSFDKKNFEDINIDEILEEKNLNLILKEIKKFPNFYDSLIDERDIYMTINLYNIQMKFPNSNILAIVGAGHKEGIERYLKELNENKKFNIEKILKFRKIHLHKKIENLIFAIGLLLIFLGLKIFEK
ncbi:MAG: TraB/GumN family protein [Candidatus Altarchaeaceae archaeon]